MIYREKLQATAKSANVIEIYVSKDFLMKPMKEFRLYENEKLLLTAKPVSVSESRSSFIYTLLLSGVTYVPGRRYDLATPQNFFVAVDISFLSDTPEFEKKYRYDGALGAIYSKASTTFRFFSPYADSAFVQIRRDGSAVIETTVMKHDLETGIFEATVPGDFARATYRYNVHLFGQSLDVVDPYSFSLDTNARHGFILDPAEVKKIPLSREKLPVFDDIAKAVVYEADVRDMTSLTDLPNKGTYAALSTPGLTDKNGLPIGLDYIASLGVSHVELQPVLDFQTVDEGNPAASYNWGYDPMYFLAPEGSYASDPQDPYARVSELRNLVRQFHEKGLRIVLDVVYNHVFSSEFNSLNLLVPRYYFRYSPNGSLSNGSGCGNDFESRHYMARKLILDSLTHCLDYYDVDGFRFDLMAILDIDTVTLAYQQMKALRPDIVFLGEGWDLSTELPTDQKASYLNASKLPFVAFFNDRFRDVIKGKDSTSGLSVRGYISGDTNYIDGFKHTYLGSSVALAFAPLFSHPRQSLNYVECHDGYTLYDKLKVCCPDYTEAELMRTIKLCNFVTLLGCGVSYIHAGQEIGLSKGGNGNSYQAGDKVNGFDYSLRDDRKEMVDYFKDTVLLKKHLIEMAGADFSDIDTHITFDNLQGSAIKITYHFSDSDLYIILNPTSQTFVYTFDDYVSLIFNGIGNISQADFFVKTAIVNGLSINVFYRKQAQKGTA